MREIYLSSNAHSSTNECGLWANPEPRRQHRMNNIYCSSPLYSTQTAIKWTLINKIWLFSAPAVGHCVLSVGFIYCLYKDKLCCGSGSAFYFHNMVQPKGHREKCVIQCAQTPNCCTRTHNGKLLKFHLFHKLNRHMKLSIHFFFCSFVYRCVEVWEASNNKIMNSIKSATKQCGPLSWCSSRILIPK